MRTSDRGIAAIKAFEGLRLQAYPDPGSGGEPWTIGYGATRYEDGSPIRPGDRIDEARAEQLLRHELEAVERAVREMVRVPITQPMFDALTSIGFNTGTGALARSTLIRRLNAGDVRGAADEFLRWRYASGRELPGLVRRREAERAMFLSELPAVADPAPELHPDPTPPAAEPPALAAPTETRPMAPVLAALLPSLVSLIPELAKLFGSGSRVATRNAKGLEVVAEKAAEIVTAATGAPNLQGAVETMQRDPAALEAARTAVRREWFDLQERSVADARKFVADYGRQHDVRTVLGRLTFPELLSLVFIGLASLGVGYLMVSRQLSGELLGGVVTLMLIGGWTEIRKFWFGLGSPEGERQQREP